MEIQGAGGRQVPKDHKSQRKAGKLNWNVQRGERMLRKIPSVREALIFHGTKKKKSHFFCNPS